MYRSAERIEWLNYFRNKLLRDAMNVLSFLVGLTEQEAVVLDILLYMKQ